MTQVRTERYDRQIDALAAMRKLAGLHISQAEYSQWESGSRVPRDDNPKVARLYEFFGSRPQAPLERSESPDSVLEAVRVLLVEIRAERAARVEWERGLLAALRELAGAGDPSGDPAPAPPAVVPR